MHLTGTPFSFKIKVTKDFFFKSKLQKSNFVRIQPEKKKLSSKLVFFGVGEVEE